MLKSFGKAPDKAQMQQSSNFRNGRFQNPIPTRTAGFKQLPRILKHFIQRDVEKSPKGEFSFREQKIPNPTHADSLLINWLGHAGVLLKIDGQFLLTDPMLSKRASPFDWLGPQRFFASPIAIEELPQIDMVIISHDHYDHLDYPTIEAIHETTNHFVVPMGVGATLRYWGVAAEKITEMDWWQETTISGLKISATPARHFTGRLFDRNNTLWNSYVLQTEAHKVYFAGDSGFLPQYSDIAKRYGPFDVSLLPIGAYFEEWPDIHMDPDEAVKTWELLNGGHFIPIHWGTFDLGLHSWYEPIQRLTQLALEKDIPLVTPRPGDWIDPAENKTDWNWWKKYSSRF